MRHLYSAIALLFLGTGVSADPVTPHDVSVFLEKRESCDHFRGEYGYDKERQDDIDWALCQSCPGTDAELKRLRKKYAGNSAVIEKLAELEDEIEPKNKAKTVRFCRSLKKPK